MDAGDVFAERFEIERVAGSGGMGVVYRARDRLTGKLVALKMLLDGDASSKRFAREARALAELDHPCIVRSIASGTHEGRAFLAMEWLDGEDLATRLARGPLDVRDAAAVGACVADALTAAHARGLVHRDVKPANVYLVGGRPDRAKLLDFGVARELDAMHPLTKTGIRLGTLGYMSPEAARGDEVDARSDLFSLGCLLYESLVGQPAFGGEHAVAVLAKILLQDPPRVRELRADVPAPLDALVARLLTKDAVLRDATAKAIRDELRRLDCAVTSLEPASRRDEPEATGHRYAPLVVVAAPPDAGIDMSTAGDLSPERSLDEVVSAYGGALLALVDGAMVVTFGTAVVAKDIAVLAARCALALKRVFPERAVVLASGRTAHSQRLPYGEVMDRAVELLASASERVRVDALTAGLVDTVFDVVVSADAFELLGVRDAGADRLLVGRRSPCVGRERELRMLRAVVEECFESSSAGGVLVTGAPGIGKTRLAHELVRHIRSVPSARLWTVTCDAMLAGSPRAVLAEIVRSLANIVTGAPSAALDKVQALAAASGASEGERIATFLGELVGADSAEPPRADLAAARLDPPRMNREIARAWDALIEAETRRGPIALVIDDFQWCDGVSVERIARTLTVLDDRPWVVVAFSRPFVDGGHPAVNEAFQRIHLGELRPRAARELVRLTLGDVDDELVEAIIARAAGNAFFLEELIRAIANGRTALPDTVLATLQARFDGLDEGARRALGAASVFGEAFWAEGLAHCVGHGPASIEPALESLVANEIVARRQSARLAGTTELTFRHALMRDAAYSMLDDASRRAFHGLALDWLVSVGEKDARVLAEHADAAARSERDRIRAAGYWLAAARRGSDAGVASEMLACCDRGLASLHGVPRGPGRDALEVGLLLVRASALAMTQGYASPDVSSIAARVLAIAEGLGEPLAVAQALTTLAGVAFLRSRFSECRELGSRALAQLEGSGAPRLELDARRMVFASALFVWDPDEAARQSLHSLPLLDRAEQGTRASPGGAAPEVMLLWHEATRLALVGRLDAALERSNGARAFAEQPEHVYSKVFAAGGDALIKVYRWEHRAAAETAASALALAEEYGFAWLMALCGSMLAMAQLYLDDPRAIRTFERAIAMMEKTGSRLSLTQVYAGLAAAHARAGDPAAARRVLETSERIELDTSECMARPYRHIVAADIARVEAPREATRAESHLRRALEEARERGQALYALWAAIELARLLAADGRGAAARAELEGALAALPEASSAAIVSEGQALLAPLG